MLPVGLMDRFANASLPNSRRAFSIFGRIRPAIFEYYSAKKMLFMFRRSARLVPAYKKFLEHHNINPSEIKKIGDFDRLVPHTTKENYIKAYSLADRCTYGEFPHNGSFEESSGTSGVPTLWVRSQQEEKYTAALTKASLLHMYEFRKEDKCIAINCFMLGGWSGGLRFASRISAIASVRNIGPYPRKVVDCIRDIGNSYTFLIAGYPPFIVELVEYGKNLENFDWKNYRINIFAGGEGFVEEWRDFISSQLRKGALIFSDYGAIDLDVGISVETPFTVALRKLLKDDEKLRHEILLSQRLPCFIGQCSPQQFYVREAISKDGMKELEITVMNIKSVSPNIKYVIGDEGGIIRFQEICKMLNKRGYSVEKIRQDFNIPAVIPFPVIYLFGRKDRTVSIDGAMISPSEVSRAILSDPELVAAINTFKISAESDSDNYIRLFVYLETRKGIQIKESLITKIRDAITNGLLNSNECFRTGYINNPDMHKPEIRLLPFGNEMFVEKDGIFKHVYAK